MSWINQAEQLVDAAWPQQKPVPFQCHICRRVFNGVRGIQTHRAKAHNIAGETNRNRKGYWKKYYKKNSTRRKQESRTYYQTHREQCLAYNRAYYQANRETEIARSREYKRRTRKKTT